MGKVRSYKDPTTATWNYRYAHTKYQAKKRGYKFNLTKKKFITLCKQPCAYCGLAPAMRINPYLTLSGDKKLSQTITPTRAKLATITISGLDRVNNLHGYTRSNVVACCKDCNKAKGTMPLQRFKNWITRIINYRRNRA